MPALVKGQVLSWSQDLGAGLQARCPGPACHWQSWASLPQILRLSCDTLPRCSRASLPLSVHAGLLFFFGVKPQSVQDKVCIHTPGHNPLLCLWKAYIFPGENINVSMECWCLPSWGSTGPNPLEMRLVLVSRQPQAPAPLSSLFCSLPHLAAPICVSIPGQVRFKQAHTIQMVFSHVAALGRRTSCYSSLWNRDTRQPNNHRII